MSGHPSPERPLGVTPRVVWDPDAPVHTRAEIHRKETPMENGNGKRGLMLTVPAATIITLIPLLGFAAMWGTLVSRMDDLRTEVRAMREKSDDDHDDITRLKEWRDGRPSSTAKPGG